MQNITISNISSAEELKQLMNSNAYDSELLYKRAIELNCQNEQFFIEWQDRLNAVSITKIEDA